MHDSAKLESAKGMEQVDVVIVGAGIAGLYATYRLRKLGLSVRVYEAGSGVGGTWFWNRYPGARCDIESMEYSYQFSEELQQEWVWSERYAAQPEVLSYLNHVADRFDLRSDIVFYTKVLSAKMDNASGLWVIKTNRGNRIEAQFCIMATGAVSSPRIPDITGLDRFDGEVFHTAKWPKKEVSFTGKNVGIIGTGTSGIQCIPIIAKDAEHLTVFQRTANYYVPIRNYPLDAESQAKIKIDYRAFRQRNQQMPYGYSAGDPMNKGSALDRTPEEQDAEYEWRWQQGGFYFLAAFEDLLRNPKSNATAADFLCRKIRSIVDDPETSEMLCPKIAFGCKRLSMGTDYYETFNRPNVSLVDISDNPITEFTTNSLRAGGGNHQLDCVVFATGFFDMVDALRRIDIRGRSGKRLSDRWEGNRNPTMYLGMVIPDFPNLFVVSGPGSPSITSNMVQSIEQNVDWIAECIDYVRSKNLHQVEAKPEAEKQWADQVDRLAAGTLYHACNSRYVGDSTNNGSRYFMPYLGYPDYVNRCNEVAANGYSGFNMSCRSAVELRSRSERTDGKPGQQQKLQRA